MKRLFFVLFAFGLFATPNMALADQYTSADIAGYVLECIQSGGEEHFCTCSMDYARKNVKYSTFLKWSNDVRKGAGVSPAFKNFLNRSQQACF